MCDAELKEPSAYKDVFFLWLGLEKKSSNMCVSVLQRDWERESEFACGCECAELGNADSVRVCMSARERGEQSEEFTIKRN